MHRTCYRCFSHVLIVGKSQHRCRKPARIREYNSMCMYTFFAGYTGIQWPIIKDKHIKIEPRIYLIFVLELDENVKSLQQNVIMIKRNIFSAATLGMNRRFSLFVERWQPRTYFFNPYKVYQMTVGKARKRKWKESKLMKEYAKVHKKEQQVTDSLTTPDPLKTGLSYILGHITCIA